MQKLCEMKKVSAIITDLDETLWKGTLAEKQKLTLNKKYYNFLKELYNKGIQIIVVSKNDKDDVDKAFEELKIETNIFTIIIANWDPKYLNIEKLLNYTEIRSETVVFVDDNPLEREELSKKIKEIQVIDSNKWEDLKYIEYIKKRETQNREEIEARVNRYKTAFSSKELKKEFIGNEDEFLKSLKRAVNIKELEHSQEKRFIQLLVETHRINFNPDTFKTYEEANRYIDNRKKEDLLLAISTSENGINLGMTGALIVHRKDEIAQIVEGTFSCSIIGRCFEHKSIIALAEMLKESGVRELEVFVKLTSTNKRVREILENLGFKEKGRRDEKLVYSIEINNLYKSKQYDWISIQNIPMGEGNFGIVSVINFFNKEVKPLIKTKDSIVNLGSARGEVLGLLRKENKDKFETFIQDKKLNYVKVDIEKSKEENNLVANAENLKKVIKDNTQDFVIAVELLEHTEHFWKVINEMIRICKVGGNIFITIPCFNYPKHEYPIDLWRIGPNTLLNFFPEYYFEVIKLEKEGDKKYPRRVMLIIKKTKDYTPKYDIPASGKTDWNTGLTIFQ